MAAIEFGNLSDDQTSHTFADLRCASRSEQRTRKRLKRCNNFQFSGRRHCPQPCASLYDHHTRKRRSNRNKHTWAKTAGRRADAQLSIIQFEREFPGPINGAAMTHDQDWIDDVVYREWEGGNWSEWCMQQGATWEIVRDWEPWKEVGETFSKWGQRRINEMRQVKEDRLRAKMAAGASSTSMPSVPEGGKGCTNTFSRAQLLETKLATTLPVTDYDVQGHASLDFLFNSPRRRKRNKLFPRVIGYCWFYEYEWYWHRNMTGCFELTSWVAHTNCSCELYALCGRWSPEDRIQPYTLEEFVTSGDVESEDGWDVISAIQTPPSLSTSSSWSVLEG